VDVYVETTVWSFAFAEDSPDYRADTVRFFDRCREGVIRPLISAIVLEEVGRTPGDRKSQLESLIRDIRPEILAVSRRAEALAQAFVTRRAIPPSKPDDARHVAVAFAESVPVLASWNFKHITNVRRAERFNVIALVEGFTHTLTIASPSELLYEP
jgi:hypothetical protein